MRNLLLSSIILFALSGCKFGHYGGLKETAKENATSFKPIFGENFSSFLYKTNIRVYGKEFSGLLITKQIQPKDYRVIFTTELGMKLFDFEFKDTSFTLHYCVSQFNRPVLLKTIQQDIEILLMNDLERKPATYHTDKKDLYDIQKVGFNNRFNYYYHEKASQHIVRIEHSKKRTIKTIFTLNDYKADLPGNIVIKHYNIKLRIELNLLKK